MEEFIIHEGAEERAGGGLAKCRGCSRGKGCIKREPRFIAGVAESFGALP